MLPIDVFREMLDRRLMDIRADGTIWKLAIRDSQQRVKVISPKRAENRSKRGYLMVKMCLNGNQYLLSAHVAVYWLMKGAIPASLDVNHRDGRKDNNHPDNLELVTRSENHFHAYRMKLRTPPERMNIQSDARELRMHGLSYSQIAERLKVSQTTAFRALQAK